MKKILCTVAVALAAIATSQAQTPNYTNEDEWQAYEDFNTHLLDKNKNIYKSDTEQARADHRGNGSRDKDVSGCAAAIWCQAIYYDMAINAYRRAVNEGDDTRIRKYKTFASNVYNGMKSHYVNFNFHDPNIGNGWFVYDDIMWWTIALARASELYSTDGAKNSTMASNCRKYSEESFLRVFYGSKKVGDDGSYADPERGLPGGMFWEWQPIEKNPNPHNANDFRSACINFPTVIAACLLHEIVPETQAYANGTYSPTRQTKEWYKEKAIEIYDIMAPTLVVSGQVYDGIHSPDPSKRAGTAWLYNEATFIGASCMLYKLTGEKKYFTQALAAVNYVYNNMCSGTNRILPLATGYEQGVYCAIFAQYISMFINDFNPNSEYKDKLTAAQHTKFVKWINNNLNSGFKNRDSRGLSNGNFQKAQTEGAYVESYGGSALPALMLMFPTETISSVQGIADDEQTAANVYSLDGRMVMPNATTQDVSHLNAGIYVHGKRKLAVK